MPWLSARIVPSFESVFVFTTAGAADVVVEVGEDAASVVAVDAAFLLEPELPHAPSASPTTTMTAPAPPREMTETRIDPPQGSTCIPWEYERRSRADCGRRCAAATRSGGSGGIAACR